MEIDAPADFGTEPIFMRVKDPINAHKKGTVLSSDEEDEIRS